MNRNKLQYVLPIICLIVNAAIILLCKVDKIAAEPSQTAERSQELRTSLHLFLPSHLMPMSPLETYTPANLFEVINGQADIYLKSGFIKLTTQRLKLKEHPSKWMEIFIYQMDRHLSAFAVFSGQRRSTAKTLKITPYAYQAHGAIFLVLDDFYVEIIGSEETESLDLVIHQFAQAFVSQNPVQARPIPELSLFPNADLNPDSMAMFPKGAFGFDRFKDVFIASYYLKDDQVTAFISRCSNPSEAVHLSIAYQNFLKEYGGGELVTPASQIPNAKLIRIHGMYELVFTYRAYVAGVHQAPTQKIAENLAKKLSASLSATD